MAMLLADEHFDFALVGFLRALGHDVLPARRLSESKSGDGIDDEPLLAVATEQRRAIITYNRADFRRLHVACPGHDGIIICCEEPKRGLNDKDIYDMLRTQAKLIDERIKQHISPAGRLTGKLIEIESLAAVEQRKDREKRTRRRRRR